MIDLSDIDPEHHEAISRLAQNMRSNGLRRDEPVRSTFALLGDRWSTLILLILAFGTWRHAELRRVLGRIGSENSISQRVMTLKLRSLERDGFVARHVTTHTPPKVSYSLTSLGYELRAEAWALIHWVVSHSARIQHARDKFDRDHQDES